MLLKPSYLWLMSDAKYQAAAALGLGRSVIYELLLAGELAGVKIGRARRIPVRSLEVFIARRMAKERTA